MEQRQGDDMSADEQQVNEAAEGQTESRDRSEEGSEWFRSSDETRIGFISGNTFDLRQVEYSVINGRAIFEGDIVLGPVEQREVILRGTPGVEPPERGIGITGPQFRWPVGIIPWEAQPALRQRVLDAIQQWEKDTEMRFVERTAANAGYSIQLSGISEAQDGCWSYVGMRGGRQVVWLGPGAASVLRFMKSDMRSACGTNKAEKIGMGSSGLSGRTFDQEESTTSISILPMGTISARMTSARSHALRCHRVQ